MQVRSSLNRYLRHNWTPKEIHEVYSLPLPDLIFRSQSVHRHYHDPQKVQLCTLLSIKTGGCPEDCAYCPQSAHYNSGLTSQQLLDVDKVMEAACAAREAGSTRFCMGAAWREVSDGPQFDRILEMVRGIRDLGLEVCCTLGMLTAEQAKRLAQAGLTAYNHNLDTSAEFYSQIISTRSYEDRLETISHVRDAGVTVCCGGIIGMGESIEDRLSLLQTLASLKPHPESVPINALVRVEGTPMADRPPVDPIEMTRMIATTRVVLPKSMVRLSAGRTEMSIETQALCFTAGANSIFTGDQLLTTPNPGWDRDRTLLKKLGLSPISP